MDEEQAEPVSFQILMTGPNGGAPGLRAQIVGWLLGNVKVFLSLRPDLNPYQQKMFLDVLRQWTTVLPFSLGSTTHPRIVIPEETEVFLSLFRDARATAAAIRIFRVILPHQAENRERDENIIREACDFCDEKANHIRELSRIGTFEIEQWVFEELYWHLKQLVVVIFGDALMKRFETAYDQQMTELLQMVQLASAPPQ